MYEYNTNLFKGDSEFKYYFLGFVAADGNLKFDTNTITITLKKSDENILHMFRDIICPGKSLKPRNIYLKETGKFYPSTTFSFSNGCIMEEVKKYIYCENKTKSLIFPYGISDRYLSHFIRGYSDGDGNIGVKRGQKKIGENIKYYYGLRYRVLGTRSFLQGMNINLRRMIDLKLASNPHKRDNENVYYTEYGFSAAKKVLDYIYRDAHYLLQRKKITFDKISSLDSDQLGESYNKPEGRYNTQDVFKVDEDIVVNNHG